MNNGTLKSLGQKSYGHIPHLPDSRMGPGDHKCSLGQAKIACSQVRDKHDHIIVQEKLDGSNVSVCKINGEIIALGRAGYRAGTSPRVQHKVFASWVGRNRNRFEELLAEEERICGEWLWQAHGTRYRLHHEPFVAFDLMAGNSRSPYQEFMSRVHDIFVTPHVISEGPPISIGVAMNRLGKYGHHGASEQVEGVVWRIERNKLIDKRAGEKAGRAVCVDFLVKYVRPNKIDGKYLDGEPVLNQLCGDER